MMDNVSKPKVHLSRRIVVVGNGEPYVAALVAALANEGCVCNQVTHPCELHKTLTNHSYDLALADTAVTGGDVTDLLQEIRRLQPGLPVVVVTADGSTAMAVRAMQNGATDFVECDSTNHVDTVARIVEILEHDCGNHAAMPENLTTREKVVLDHILQGLGNRTIAFQLGLSVRTVEDHRRKVMTKLGAGNIVELVKICASRGIMYIHGNRSTITGL